MKCDWEKIELLPLPKLIKKWMLEHSMTRRGMQRYEHAKFQLVHNLNLRIDSLKPFDPRIDAHVMSFFKILINTQNFSNGKGYKVNITEIMKQTYLYENAMKILQEHRFVKLMRPQMLTLKCTCCILIFMRIKCNFGNVSALPLPDSLKSAIFDTGMAVDWYEAPDII